MYYLLDSENYLNAYSFDTSFEGGGIYEGPIPEDFENQQMICYKILNGEIQFDEEKKMQVVHRNNLYAELEELTNWVEEYDKIVNEYNRCVRLGIFFGRDMTALDTQAVQKQERIIEIREALGITSTI